MSIFYFLFFGYIHFCICSGCACWVRYLSDCNTIRRMPFATGQPKPGALTDSGENGSGEEERLTVAPVRFIGNVLRDGDSVVVGVDDRLDERLQIVVWPNQNKAPRIYPIDYIAIFRYKQINCIICYFYIQLLRAKKSIWCIRPACHYEREPGEISKTWFYCV